MAGCVPMHDSSSYSLRAWELEGKIWRDEGRAAKGERRVAARPLVVRPLASRLADAWSVFQRPPLGCKGIGYPGQSRSCSATNKPHTACVAFASKKGGQSHNTSDLDNERDLVTEADLEYKPVGFGQSKVYDTSLEEKLLEEIERDKAAQAATLQKQKNRATSTNSSKTKSTSEHPSTVNGIKVWVGDLPKKRNIDRDLRSAFRHTPGLLNVSPCVLGNEKTRDPICKGFGFLTFDTVDHAKSFIVSFQGRPLSFGKVEKKVIFKLMKANDAELLMSGKNSSAEVGRLRIRDNDAVKVAGSCSNPESVSLKTVGQNVLHTDTYQPQVEVIEDGGEVGSFQSYGESSSEEEESDDDFDLEDESEIEISVDYGDLSENNTLNDAAENNDLSAAEKRIQALERRLIKKLEEAGYGSKKGEREENIVKGRGIKSKKFKALKQSSPKGNNMAAVTHGLKRREREFMTGALEKYGKIPSTTKP